MFSKRTFFIFVAILMFSAATTVQVSHAQDGGGFLGIFKSKKNSSAPIYVTPDNNNDPAYSGAGSVKPYTFKSPKRKTGPDTGFADASEEIYELTLASSATASDYRKAQHDKWLAYDAARAAQKNKNRPMNRDEALNIQSMMKNPFQEKIMQEQKQDNRPRVYNQNQNRNAKPVRLFDITP